MTRPAATVMTDLGWEQAEGDLRFVKKVGKVTLTAWYLRQDVTRPEVPLWGYSRKEVRSEKEIWPEMTKSPDEANSFVAKYGTKA